MKGHILHIVQAQNSKTFVHLGSWDQASTSRLVLNLKFEQEVKFLRFESSCLQAIIQQSILTQQLNLNIKCPQVLWIPALVLKKD